jgi:hypothetical protein
MIPKEILKTSVHIIGVIDVDGNEALYVNGDLHPIDGSTIYYVDIFQAANGRQCVLSHVEINNVLIEERGDMTHIVWPDKFEDLMPYVVKGLE